MTTTLTFAAITLPARFIDIIEYTYYSVLAIFFLAACAFAIWAGLSLERREEAMLKMKGVMIGFALVFAIGAIFDTVGWGAKIGISFTGL